jgi:hypothetical protein
MPRSSPSTLPRVISLVLHGTSSGYEYPCVLLLRDIPPWMDMIVLFVCVCGVYRSLYMHSSYSNHTKCSTAVCSISNQIN